MDSIKVGDKVRSKVIGTGTAFEVLYIDERFGQALVRDEGGDFVVFALGNLGSEWEIIPPPPTKTSTLDVGIDVSGSLTGDELGTDKFIGRVVAWSDGTYTWELA